MKLCSTYVMEKWSEDEGIAYMCVGHSTNDMTLSVTAVLTPYYSDDEDCSPELHPADGLLLVPSIDWDDWKEIKFHKRSGYLEFVLDE